MAEVIAESCRNPRERDSPVGLGTVHGVTLDFHSGFFHVGIRVPDIERAMHEMTSSMGTQWASVQDRQATVWVPGEGMVTWRQVLTYSVQGPIHVELLHGPKGSIWDGDDAPGIHHLGYWVDDVGVETTRLLADGWTLELAASAPQDGYGRFTYLRSPNGILVEPLAVASKARFERWWAGGPLESASS